MRWITTCREADASDAVTIVTPKKAAPQAAYSPPHSGRWVESIRPRHVNFDIFG